MTGARGRIVVVAGVLVVALGVVLVHLASLMIFQHETWLERSCRNRWAFRDVPPRRGAIQDRTGVVLVQDDPGWSLWLDPARFLQSHPLGLAYSLHATLGFAAASEPELVLHAVLSTRMDALDDPAAPAERRKLARDLALAMLRSLLPRTLTVADRTKLANELRAALGTTRILLDLVPSGVRDEASKLLSTRLAGFRMLRERLRLAGANDPADLLAALARKDKRAQVPQRRLAKRIPYELVVDLTLERELWPGLVCLPSVERQRGLPGRDGLLSLETLIGRARQYQGSEDEETPGADEAQASADQALASLTELEGAWDDEAESLADLASRQARTALVAYYKRTARFGNSGVEKLCNTELEGTPGLRWTERDSRADERRLFASFDVLPGRDVRLTIDARLQSVLESTLDRFEPPQDGECGFTLIDADSGDILALGGRPLVDAEGRPWWTTPAVAWKGPGDLGSVAKPFVLIENYESERLGLPCSHAGEFGPCKKGYPVPGIPGRVLKCDAEHGTRGQDPIEALSRSCNYWFFQSGAGLGAEGLKRAFVRVGLLPEPGSGPRFQSEIAGIDPELTRPVSRTNRFLLEQRAIGYGLEASTFRVARAYAALWRGVLPTLSLVAGPPRQGTPIDVDAAPLELVRQGLRKCVTQGTAANARRLASLGGMAKTGTAEINQKTHANNAWLAGLIPGARGGALAFAAVVYGAPDSVHGGEIAAALVEDFLERLVSDPALKQEWLGTGGGR